LSRLLIVKYCKYYIILHPMTIEIPASTCNLGILQFTKLKKGDSFGIIGMPNSEGDTSAAKTSSKGTRAWCYPVPLW
jgi:hypothetical protein